MGPTHLLAATRREIRPLIQPLPHAAGCDNDGVLRNIETLNDWLERALLVAYRINGYALTQWADDAAMLAIIFC